MDILQIPAEDAVLISSCGSVPCAVQCALHAVDQQSSDKSLPDKVESMLLLLVKRLIRNRPQATIYSLFFFSITDSKRRFEFIHRHD